MLPDKPKSFCGIFGIFGSSSASFITYYGLHALQHRGQEASGIVSAEKKLNGKSIFNVHKGLGLVSEIYDDSILENVLKGFSAITDIPQQVRLKAVKIYSLLW